MIMELGLRPSTWITTNGTIWNRRVERIVDELHPNVVVSMDGFQAGTYEAIRVGADFAQVTANLARFREAGERAGTITSVAFHPDAGQLAGATRPVPLRGRARPRRGGQHPDGPARPERVHTRPEPSWPRW